MRKDLVLHMILGFLIAGITAFVIQKFWIRELMIIATPITIIVGLAKELVWDKWMKQGTPEFKDLWCDMWGALVATILSYWIW